MQLWAEEKCRGMKRCSSTSKNVAERASVRLNHRPIEPVMEAISLLASTSKSLGYGSHDDFLLQAFSADTHKNRWIAF